MSGTNDSQSNGLPIPFLAQSLSGVGSTIGGAVGSAADAATAPIQASLSEWIERGLVLFAGLAFLIIGLVWLMHDDVSSIGTRVVGAVKTVAAKGGGVGQSVTS